MRKTVFIPIIYMLILGYGCIRPKPTIEGLWVSAYQIKTDPNRGIVDYKKFMRIDGDSIVFRTTGAPKNGFDPWRIKSEFERTNEGIEIGDKDLDKIYIHGITDDSLIVSYESQNSTREVFQKLHRHKAEINWNPENKSYEWKGNSSFVNTTFLKNGLFIDYLPETDDVSVGHWNTIKEENNLFIVFDKLNIVALSVDSLSGDEVYLSIHDHKKFDYSLTEKNLKIPTDLLGEWALISTDTLRTNYVIPRSDSKLPTTDFLSISKDSILTIKGNVKSTAKWTIGGASNLIIFPDVKFEKDSLEVVSLSRKERSILRNIFKIDSLSENELVILTEYDLFHFEEFLIKLTYHRKNRTR